VTCENSECLVRGVPCCTGRTTGQTCLNIGLIRYCCDGVCCAEGQVCTSAGTCP
jgi:hypothetical protein